MDMAPNRFGIPEPAQGRECDPERLELVLTPLVAFAGNGTRLGMGAGFYDKTFAFARNNPSPAPGWSARPTSFSRSTACRPNRGMCRWAG